MIHLKVPLPHLYAQNSEDKYLIHNRKSAHRDFSGFSGRFSDSHLRG